jgi:hypothetical protein
MKMKIRPDDLSMLQLDDWLAELRKVGWTEPPAAARAKPARAEPAVRAEPVVPAEPARAEPVPAEPVVPAEPARAEPVPAEAARAEAAPHAQAAHTTTTVRAVIGDQLRMPIMWCELGSCTSSHADPAALGESDMRARAIDAGWRIDAFGRLACPRCQRSDPNFRATHQPVPWDRYTAMARTARIVAERSDPAQPEYSAPPECRVPPAYPVPREYQPAGIIPAGWRKL